MPNLFNGMHYVPVATYYVPTGTYYVPIGTYYVPVGTYPKNMFNRLSGKCFATAHTCAHLCQHTWFVTGECHHVIDLPWFLQSVII